MGDVGTCRLHGDALWRWERVRDLGEGIAVFAWDFEPDPRGEPFFVTAPTDAPTDMLCHHEHARADHAAACPDVERALVQRESAARLTRAAALPPIPGVRFATHCGRYWEARHGGACGACGAPADALAPRVVLRRNHATRMLFLDAFGLHVGFALADAGVASARLLWTDAAVVHGLDLDAVDAIRDKLVAAGWLVESATGRKVVPMPQGRPRQHRPRLRAPASATAQLTLLRGDTEQAREVSRG